MYENAPQTNPPTPPVNVNLSSSPRQAVFSKGLQENNCPCFTSSRRILKATAAPWAFLYCMHKGPVDPRRLNPAASDAHPADVVVFTSLASSHQAVLRSPRLNELRFLGGWRLESVRCSSFFLIFFFIIINDSFFKYKKKRKQQQQNKSQSNRVLYPLKISASSPLILWSWTVTTTMSASATFTAVTPLSSELRVKLKPRRKSVFAAFKIKAGTCELLVKKARRCCKICFWERILVQYIFLTYRSLYFR